jgi:hypothetical protein
MTLKWDSPLRNLLAPRTRVTAPRYAVAAIAKYLQGGPDKQKVEQQLEGGVAAKRRRSPWLAGLD